MADLRSNAGYMAERRVMPSVYDADAGDAIRWNQQRCRPPVAQTVAPGPSILNDNAMPLSPGDLLRLSLPGNEPPSGLFKVDSNRMLSLDQLGDIDVTGLTVKQAEAELARSLVQGGYYRAGHAHVVLRVLDRGAIRIRVSGAVFQPGQVVINQKGASDRDVSHDTAAGDHALGRSLSNAISNAAGVRPDADVTGIAVTRAGRRQVLDLTGLLTGEGSNDVLLAEGDHVEVPSRGCFQIDLARPSPVTMPGVRAFISNLTVPAASNASSAVGREATTFPYGTRFLQALVSGNCVGGTQSTNADRFGVLMSTNPINGGTEVIERRIEDLVRRADRDGYNPVILPGDAVACYDSAMTNIRDVAKTVSDLLLGGIVKP
jgi:protein involved in polysaccharide export with SLBB domain